MQPTQTRRVVRFDFNQLAIAFIITSFLAIAGLVLAFIGPLPNGDTPIYSTYAKEIIHGALPYRDFHLEYPPGVLPFIILAAPIGGLFQNYQVGFMLLCMMVMAIILADLIRRQLKKTAIAVVLVLLPISQFVFMELEIFVGIFLYASIRAIKNRSYNLSALTLAAATLIKGYPLVCLLPLLIYVPANYRRKYLAIYLAAILAGSLPFLILSPNGLFYSFHYHALRPIQIESGPAAIGFVLHFLGEPIARLFSYGSVNIRFAHDGTVQALSFLALVAIIVLFARKLLSGRERMRPAMASLALLVAFVLTFKVGSPQFMVPVVIVGALASEEINQPQAIQLAVRLLLINLVIFAEITDRLIVKVSLPGELLIIAKFILLAELLVWSYKRTLKTARITKSDASP